MENISESFPKYTKVTSKNGKVYYKKPLDTNRRDKNKYYENHKIKLQKQMTIQRIIENKNVSMITLKKHNIDKIEIINIFSNKIKKSPENFDKLLDIQNKFIEKLKVTNTT